MNAVFTVIMLVSSAVMLIICPSEFLPSLTDGARQAAETALTLFFIYAIWMGLSAVAEDSRLSERISGLIRTPIKKIFRTDDEQASTYIAMNVSCNLLGLGGAATPYAVRAIERLEKSDNDFAQNALFIVNATSIQLIPATVIALRSSLGSAAAYDITLPSLIATIISTGTAYLAYVAITALWSKGCGGVHPVASAHPGVRVHDVSAV